MSEQLEDAMLLRNWDQTFESWKNNCAPLDDPDFAVPGDHPCAFHPWNFGIEGRKHFLELSALDPALLDEVQPEPKLEEY